MLMYRRTQISSEIYLMDCYALGEQDRTKDLFYKTEDRGGRICSEDEQGSNLFWLRVSTQDP
jgi:hypothetical protein